MKPILSFLKTAYYLQGLLMTSAIWYGCVYFIVWAAEIHGETREAIIATFSILGLLLCPMSALAWCASCRNSARYQAQIKTMAHLRANLIELYKANPDFLGILNPHTEPFLIVYVKAAPYGHPFPHSFDGIKVHITVEDPNLWYRWVDHSWTKAK